MKQNNVRDKLRKVALVGGITAVVGGLTYLHIISGKENLEWVAENERTEIVRPVLEVPGNEVFRFTTEDGSEIRAKPDYRLEDHPDYSSFSERLKSRIEMFDNSELIISGYNGRLSGYVDNSNYFMLTRIETDKNKFSIWDLK